MFVPILVVEDDGAAAAAISKSLGQSGFCPVVAPSAHHAVVLARQLAPHLVVLSLDLRDVDGLRVLHALRHNGYRNPLLAVTGEAGMAAEALRAGADDVLTRPVIAHELVARARALGTHAAPRSPQAPPIGAPAESDVYTFQGFVAIAATRSLTRDGTPVALGEREFDLLLALLRRRGAVASRRELLEEVWGAARRGDPRIVDRHVMELRRRIEPDPAAPRYVLTVWKAGYRFRFPDEERHLVYHAEQARER